MVTEIKPMYPPAIQSDDEGVVAQQIPSGAITPVEHINENWFPAISSEVLLGSLRDGRLRVYSPIKIKFEEEGEHTIAEAVELNEFGFGENPSEALADLQRTIAELYFTLEGEQSRLGKDLQNVWNGLKEKILKR